MKQEGNIKYQGGKSDTKNKFKFLLPLASMDNRFRSLNNFSITILLNYTVPKSINLIYSKSVVYCGDLMDKNEVSILNPEKDEIKKSVEAYEEEWGFGDKLIYIECVKRMGKVKLNNITEKDVNESIKVFLINWGMMGRVLWREDIKIWEGRILDSLKKISSELEKFRKLKLEEPNISDLEDDIKKCYCKLKINDTVGSVSAAKILHLICPNFFPLWNAAIRVKVSDECYKLNTNRIGDSATGYYKFMIINQEFLNKKDNILLKLSKDYKKSKLRIIDEFMWWVTDEERKRKSHEMHHELQKTQ